MRAVMPLLLCLLLVGCTPTAQPQPAATGPEPPSELAVARDFLLASGAMDDSVLSLIPPVPAAVAPELTPLLHGSEGDVSSPDSRWDGDRLVVDMGEYSYVLREEGPRVAVMATSETEPVEKRLVALTVERQGNKWHVTKVDGRQSYQYLLMGGANSQRCQSGMWLIQSATGYAHTITPGDDPDDLIREPGQLVPDYLTKLPECPSGGRYSMYDGVVPQCSVHGIAAPLP